MLTLIFDIILRILFSVLAIGFGAVVVGLGIVSFQDEVDTLGEKIIRWAILSIIVGFSAICLLVAVGIWTV